MKTLIIKTKKMTIEEEKHIRKAIQQGLKNKFSLSETDLLAPSNKSWDNMKIEFKKLITNLISNLENDEYDDASGDISKSIGILQTWNKKIKKDINDSSINENSEFTAKQVVWHYLDDAFKNYVNVGTEQFTYGPDEDGTYTVSVTLSIPRNYFKDLEEATFETNKQLSKNYYEGPGQSFSKSSVHAIKQNEQFYILGMNIRGGYDI